jgi:hypothetical protein
MNEAPVEVATEAAAVTEEVQAVDMPPHQPTEQGSIAAETARFLEDLATPGPEEDREVFAYAWIARCLRAGGAGIAELRAWLTSGQDVSFESGRIFDLANDDEEESGDLRSLILSSMERWPDADAVDTAMELLRNPRHADDVLDLVEQLNKHGGSGYRTEIVARLREMLGDENAPGALEAWIKQAVVYHDPAMLAEVESRAAQNPSTASSLLSAAFAMPASEAQVALNRIAARPELLRAAANFSAITLKPEVIQDPWMRTFAAHTLFPAMEPEAQVRMITSLTGYAAYLDPKNGLQFSQNAIDALLFGSVGAASTSLPQVLPGPPDAGANSSMPEDRLALVNLLGPHIQNAEVRTAWQKVREDLQRAIANRPSTSAAKGP